VGKIKTILYQMERSLRLIKARSAQNDDWKENLPESLLDTPPHEQVAWIFDCRRFAKKDYNLALAKSLAVVLDHYPEKLGVVFALDTPVLFRAFWKIAKTMVDEKTVRKVAFVTGDDGRKKIFPIHFDLDQLETCFLGNNAYNYHHENYYKMLRKEEADNITILTQPEGSEKAVEDQRPLGAPEEEELDLRAGEDDGNEEKESPKDGDGEKSNQKGEKKPTPKGEKKPVPKGEKKPVPNSGSGKPPPQKKVVKKTSRLW